MNVWPLKTLSFSSVGVGVGGVRGVGVGGVEVVVEVVVDVVVGVGVGVVVHRVVTPGNLYFA